MFLLAYQLSTRVLDRGKELIDQEVTQRVQQKICLSSLKPEQVWNLQRINSSASGVLRSWLSRATHTLKHALHAELLTTNLVQNHFQEPFYMGNLQNDLQVMHTLQQKIHCDMSLESLLFLNDAVRLDQDCPLK